MPKIIQLSPHVANLIAAGEVVERPASVAKELLENAVDAGASQVTIEIRDGGMTFLRVTDNGSGMSPEDARVAFQRHATSKLRSAEDLAAISSMGFRGEALAAIASVSRVDLLTRTAGGSSGISLHLEAGCIQEDAEAGCPEGTTIIIRDLFFNTPARMKFMKADTVEGGRVTAAVQLQALAHPSVAFRFLRDGKEILSTPGDGKLESAIYCVYGRESARMVRLESRWDSYSLAGFVSKPTDARPSRSLQTYFVNGRPVRSKLLTSALEEAYRNQIMVGKFPACVLHLTLPASAVDVNVHPAKTEVKFLNEKAVFDCVHYGVLGVLNKTPDRPQMQFRQTPVPQNSAAVPEKKPDFFQAMPVQEYRPVAAPKAFLPGVERASAPAMQEYVITPSIAAAPTPVTSSAGHPPAQAEPLPVSQAAEEPPAEQVSLPMPQEIPWRMVGELYRSYILVEQGEDAYLIDKHAAHERILFDKLRENQEAITAQSLLSPIPCRLSPELIAALLTNRRLLEELGFEIEEFGGNTVLLRQVPMDLDVGDAQEALEELAVNLISGKQADKKGLRDELLHTVACKAAIKAGWHTDEQELLALVKAVMAREDLKYCPHGRPICVTLSKKQLEKQFKRT
ncbi:MAG TPA: DNA mismatch repair endonuclease MutL [Candidatus Faecousia intestinigallinarum]|nr:DNA mismatch repair endonuclease MutL [Candidatus Faecousia intestinigallinarum]